MGFSPTRTGATIRLSLIFLFLFSSYKQRNILMRKQKGVYKYKLFLRQDESACMLKEPSKILILEFMSYPIFSYLSLV